MMNTWPFVPFRAVKFWSEMINYQKVSALNNIFAEVHYWSLSLLYTAADGQESNIITIFHY